MTERLEDRLRQYRQRVLIRSWEYRQRRHAHGVWHRLRRVLTDADATYTVSGEDASTLATEGYRPEPVGAELNPPKTIVFVPRERLAGLPSARPVPLKLGIDLLAAEYLVLTPFAPPDRRAAEASWT